MNDHLFLSCFLPLPFPVSTTAGLAHSGLPTHYYYNTFSHTTIRAAGIMPRYQSIRSRNFKDVNGKEETSERGTTSTDDTSSLSSDMSHTRKPSKMKEMSTKAAKGVKRQLRRLDDFLHHVTHTKHDSTESTSSSVENIRRRTLSVPTPPVSIAFERTRTRSTWNTAKYAKEADQASSESLSTSVEIGIQTDIIEEAE